MIHIYRVVYPYLCLYHVAPPVSHTTYKSKDIHCMFSFDPLQLCIKCDECTSSTHTSTVNNIIILEWQAHKTHVMYNTCSEQ